MWFDQMYLNGLVVAQTCVRFDLDANDTKSLPRILVRRPYTENTPKPISQVASDLEDGFVSLLKKEYWCSSRQVFSAPAAVKDLLKNI